MIYLEMEVCHAISLSSLILFVLSYCKQWGHGDKANSSIFIKCYCHLAVGIISKMQLLTKNKTKTFLLSSAGRRWTHGGLLIASGIGCLAWVLLHWMGDHLYTASTAGTLTVC